MLLKLLDVEHFVRKLKPVTSTNIYVGRSDKFHEEGLFSEIIFGKEKSNDRRKTFSFIDLNSYIIHPTALTILTNMMDRKISKYLSTEKSFSVDDDGNLIEDENGVTGIDAFIKLFPKINFRADTEGRIAYIEVLKKAYKDKTLFINKIPVIPPEFRPVVKDEETGDIIVDPLNDQYISILRRAASIKTVGSSGPLYDIMNYWLQNSVADCDEFIRTRISKKYGLIRNQMLGKRIEFSARAVIINGPTLHPNEMGIPFRMAVSLFEPFIIHILLYTDTFNHEEMASDIKDFNGMDLAIDSVKKVLTAIRNDDKVPERLYNTFYKATEMAMTNRAILAKRDPVLIPESVRAYKPILTKGGAISICNLQTSGHGADFDGDQMAVFHPLSVEAQEDAMKMMKSQSGTSSTSIAYSIEKEACVGMYLLTKEYKSSKTPIRVTKEDLDKAISPEIPVIYKSRTTTMGKAIFNNILPDGFRFVDDMMTKSSIKKLLFEIYTKYPADISNECAYKIEQLGYKFATIMAPSLTLDQLALPKEILKLKEKLDTMSPNEAAETVEKMKAMMLNYLKDTGLFYLADSGSTKGWDQPTQMLIAKGVIADVNGKLLPPIKGSFSDGLSASEYFKVSLGTRKGIVDRVLNTADTGYISRQLAYLLNSVELDWLLEDCKTKRTLELKLTKGMVSRLQGRYVVVDNKIVEFNPSLYKEGDIINLRSPIYCKSMKICHTCYGKLLERHKSPYIGILAAQVIGERGTQLIMRTFHTGGAVKVKVRDILSEIITNDPYVDRALISKILKQDDTEVKSLKKLTVTLEMEDYDSGDDLLIDEDNGTIWVKSLLATLETEDGQKLNFILDYACELNISNGFTKEGKERIVIDYDENDKVMNAPLEVENIKQLILYLKRLVGGKEIYKDTNHLLMKIYKIYEPISDMDLVHMEVLLSQCLRDKERPILPSRIGKDPDDPLMFNIKKNVFTTSFLQGLAFENIGEAIRTGLVSKYELEPSVLEKVLTGTLVEPPEDIKKKLKLRR